MIVVRCLAKLALSAGLLVFGYSSTTVASERWLVLPFENLSDKAEYNWLGEGMALLLSDLLSVPGTDVITPRERRAAYGLLAFPTTAILSHASAIRLAQETGADLLVVGTYTVTRTKGNEQVSLSIQLIDVPAGMLSQHPFEAGAPMADLLELQGILAWDLLISQQVPVAVSRNQFVSRLRTIPPRAFELFVKADLAKDLTTRTELLRAALKQLDHKKTESPFQSAIYDLGQAFYQQGNSEQGILWLSQVKPGGLYYREAQFYLGLCYFSHGELDKAASIYAELMRTVPTTSVFNNLAVIETKQRHYTKAVDYLTMALAVTGDNPDLWFNSGYALWLDGNYEMAAAKFREAVRRRADDAEAQYLLAKCLAELGRHQEAKTALDKARKSLPAVAKWERSGQVPMLARIMEELDRLALSRSDDQRSSEGTIGAMGTQPRWLDRALMTAESLAAQKRDQEALAFLEVLLRQTPDSARAHFLKACLHEQRKDYPTAIAELRAATFWDPRFVAAHVRLGKMYLTVADTGHAWDSLRRALALEPDNEEALALQRAILQTQYR
jgi:tetratricopeptide (TPR) repeat protein/TolB-like protein